MLSLKDNLYIISCKFYLEMKYLFTGCKSNKITGLEKFIKFLIINEIYLIRIPIFGLCEILVQ